MHLLVRSDMSIEDAHLISHRVSKNLKEEFKDISDVVVHIEPYIQQSKEPNYNKNS
jgi:divalent metal cation (Fe/Co/Zn/Cd) transporter